MLVVLVLSLVHTNTTQAVVVEQAVLALMVSNSLILAVLVQLLHC